MAVKLVYITMLSGTKLAWIAQGRIKSYLSMADVLNRLTSEELDIFDRHFGF